MSSSDVNSLITALQNAFTTQNDPEKQAQWETILADIQPGWQPGQQFPYIGDFLQYLIDLQQERLDSVDADWDTAVSQQHTEKIAKKVESFSKPRQFFAKLWGMTDAKHNTKKSKLFGAAKKAITFGLGSFVAGKAVKYGFTTALGVGVAAGVLSAAPVAVVGGVGFGVYKLVKSVGMAKVIETHQLNKILADRSPELQTLDSAEETAELLAIKKRNALALGGLSAGIAYMSADDLLGDAFKKVWHGIQNTWKFGMGVVGFPADTARDLLSDSETQPSTAVQPTDGGETATPTSEETAAPEEATTSVESSEPSAEEPTSEATASATPEATDADTTSAETSTTESSPSESAEAETPVPDPTDAEVPTDQVPTDPAAVQEAQDAYKEARIDYREAEANGATTEELNALDEARKEARANYAELAGITEKEARLEVGDMLATEEVSDAKKAVSDLRTDLQAAEDSLAQANEEIAEAKAILEQEPNNIPAQEQLDQAKLDKAQASKDIKDITADLGEAKAELGDAKEWQAGIQDKLDNSSGSGPGDTPSGPDSSSATEALLANAEGKNLALLELADKVAYPWDAFEQVFGDQASSEIFKIVDNAPNGSFTEHGSRSSESWWLSLPNGSSNTKAVMKALVAARMEQGGAALPKAA